MRVPEQATRVFSGIIHDVYQWEQVMFDGSTGTFEKIKRTPSANVLVVQEGNIMVLMQEQPGFSEFPSLPGGRVDEKDVLEAAKRELLEETGYTAEEWVTLGEWFGYSKLEFHETTFVARNCRKVQKPELDAGEKIRLKWLPFEEFLQLCRNSKFRAPIDLKFMMYEALLDAEKKQALREKIFG